MAVNYFTPTASAEASFTTTTSRIVIPGSSPTVVKVTNLGNFPIAVLLGNSSVVVTVATGLIILPKSAEYLGVGSNTNIAGIVADASAIQACEVNLTVGS